MNNVRWYDKDPYLSSIVKILENLPQNLQASVAEDLLQIIMSITSDTIEKKMEFLNKNVIPNCRRWYDVDPNMHTSMELLKTLDEATKREVCESVLEFLFQIMIDERPINE